MLMRPRLRDIRFLNSLLRRGVRFAAQRCMAYQTLGRILFRLGQGEFGVERARQDTDGAGTGGLHVPDASDSEGDEDEDVGSAMANGAVEVY